MFSYVAVITVCVLILLAIAVYKNGYLWLKTKEGLGILRGAIIAPVAAILIAVLLCILGLFLSGCSSFEVKDPYISVFAGAEATKNLSPQCEEGGASDRITSNLGVMGCASVSPDSWTVACFLYRHHSCAISPDDRSYDAGGFQIERRLYISP